MNEMFNFNEVTELEMGWVRPNLCRFGKMLQLNSLV